MHSLPNCWHPPPEWYICYNWRTYINNHNGSKSTVFSFSYFLAMPCGKWDLSSPTRDWIHAPGTGRWILNQWTAGEVFTVFTLGFIICFVHSMDLDKCIVTCTGTRLCYLTENFHCRKNPLCSTYSTRPPHPVSGNTDFVTVSIVLPFPACHIVGIINIAFSDIFHLVTFI